MNSATLEEIQSGKSVTMLGKHETSVMETDATVGAKSSPDLGASQPQQSLKKSRKRKKQIYNAIRQQMEFYFSDANLSKDRYLMKLISEDPEIPLSVFMNFNKIKALVASVEEIEKAVSTSEKLCLSEDRKKVRRVVDFGGIETRCADECTIYVEALPTSATHDWVRKVFEQYGPVAYVSLPKFRTSHQIKEFAFVEFESRTSVLKAINSFSQFGGALNMSSDPDKLASITAYLREHEHEGTEDKQPDESHTSQPIAAVHVSDNDSEPAKKKAKSTVKYEESATAETNIVVSNEAATIHGTEDEEDEIEEEDEDGTKKKVRRKKTTSKNHHKTPVEQHLDASINTLRITTKLEWKRLRNKYLNQQREKVKQMKKQLWLERKPFAHKGAQPNKDALNLPPASSKGGQSKTTDGEKISRHPKKINFYGANKDSTATQNEDAVRSKSGSSLKHSSMQVDVVEKAPLFSYEPGIIAKITFNEPCVDVKDFKAEMRQHPFVRYVDVKEGDMSAFVRVDSAASTTLLTKHAAPLMCSVLGGTDEEAYWEKINGDRHQKINKQLKVKPKRGREKVAKVVVNHLRFED